MLLLVVTLLTIVQLNCENLFDTSHDKGKADSEYMPDGPRRWTPRRYWTKLDNTAKAIIASGESDGKSHLPDLVALCEVENDSVLRDLTRRSLLRTLNFGYVITHSPDRRGIDVALVYNQQTVNIISHTALRIAPPKGMRPTRDILYAKARHFRGDTLHIFVVHSPSRSTGASYSETYRLTVAERLGQALDSISAAAENPKIIVAGDFNDEPGDKSISAIEAHNMADAAAKAVGSTGIAGTYKYKGAWSRLDHIFLSPALAAAFHDARINDAPFLLAPDKTYGGQKPARTYDAYRYSPDGFSDHLPLIVRVRIGQ